jgi:type IV pilus assembly protein PilP
MRSNKLIFSGFLVVASMLSGCSDGTHEDLVVYMQEVRQRPAKPIEPIPTFKEYKSFVYAAAAKRSPFEAPVTIVIEGYEVTPGESDVKPDPLRPKEYLEEFPISAIKMVGTLEKGGQLWALVADSSSNVHPVKI